jgi:hypothetical protein
MHIQEHLTMNIPTHSIMDILASNDKCYIYISTFYLPNLMWCDFIIKKKLINFYLLNIIGRDHATSDLVNKIEILKQYITFLATILFGIVFGCFIEQQSTQLL